MARTLRRQTLSMRGEPVDFAALAAHNQTQPTLGNTKTNVRGDVLGDNAVVLKTQEQIEAEWARKRSAQQTVTTMRDPKQSLGVKKGAPVSDMDFPTVSDLVKDGSITGATKRKIVDSE